MGERRGRLVMDRNDIRTNIRIRISGDWKHHIQNTVEQYHHSIEGWEKTWDGAMLCFILNGVRIAEVNKGGIYLSETVKSYSDIPLGFLEQSIAQSIKV